MSTAVTALAAACLPSVECTANLIVFFQLEREIVRYEAAWLAGVPYWDAKVKLGEHLLEDAQHGEALLKRLHELKAATAEHKQIVGVESILRAVARAASGDEWLHGLYGVLKPWLAAQLRDYLEHSDAMMDAPSHQAIHRILEDLDRQIAWFKGYRPRFSPWEQPDVSAWLGRMRQLVQGARLAGGAVAGLPAGGETGPAFGPFETPRRDRTFRVTTQREPKYTIRAEQTTEEKRFAIFYNHTQEMQFAESLGAILFETAEMPWAYHHDIARHISDEVRHSWMGQVRLEQLGYRLEDMPMMTQNYEFRSHLDPLERFCLMTLVMEASGFELKRANIAMFNASGDEVSSRYADYDVRDELLHTNLGHAWVPIMLRVYHDSRSVNETIEHCRSLVAGLPTEYPAGRFARPS